MTSNSAETGQTRPARAPRFPFTDEFKTFLNEMTEHFHAPSMSIGVIDGDESFVHVQGHATLPDKTATEDTLYYIASVTKSFTATTLLSLLTELEETKSREETITLKTKIASILPGDFVLPDPYATSHATLEDALGHLLGIGDHNLSYGGEGYTLRDAVRSLRHLSMTAEFRQKHQYLNLGYMVIQHVIETLSGKEIGELHHKYIWDPLGMSSSFAKPSDAAAAPNDIAMGYSWDPLIKELGVAQYPRDFPLIGGGGLISSIKDMTKYLDAVIHNKFSLPSSKYEELFQPRSIAGKPSFAHMTTLLYGLGWNISSYRGRRLVSHSGGISGFRSKLIFLPDEKWGIALLTNSDDGYNAIETSILRLLDDFLQVPREQRQDVVAQLDRKAEELQEFNRNIRSILYPSLPSPRLDLGLPLSSYAGSYHNPGYRTIELTVIDAPKHIPVAEGTKQVLHADIRRLLDITMDLEHISGEFFIGWIDTDEPSAVFRTGLRSQFELGSDGKAKRWCIDLGSEGGGTNEKMMVWFDRT